MSLPLLPTCLHGDPQCPPEPSLAPKPRETSLDAPRKPIVRVVSLYEY